MSKMVTQETLNKLESLVNQIRDLIQENSDQDLEVFADLIEEMDHEIDEIKFAIENAGMADE